MRRVPSRRPGLGFSFPANARSRNPTSKAATCAMYSMAAQAGTPAPSKKGDSELMRTCAVTRFPATSKSSTPPIANIGARCGTSDATSVSIIKLEALTLPFQGRGACALCGGGLPTRCRLKPPCCRHDRSSSCGRTVRAANPDARRCVRRSSRAAPAAGSPGGVPWCSRRNTQGPMS